MWHVTHGWRWTLYKKKVRIPSWYGLGLKVFWRFGGTDSLNQEINKKCVCRILIQSLLCQKTEALTVWALTPITQDGTDTSKIGYETTWGQCSEICVCRRPLNLSMCGIKTPKSYNIFSFFLYIFVGGESNLAVFSRCEYGKASNVKNFPHCLKMYSGLPYCEREGNAVKMQRWWTIRL